MARVSPGRGLLVVILEKVNIGTGGGHFLYLFRNVCKGFRKGTKREIVVGPNAVVKLDDCGNSAERVNLKGTAKPTELRVIVEFERATDGFCKFFANDFEIFEIHFFVLYREPARAVGFIIEPGYKYSAFFLKPKIFS